MPNSATPAPSSTAICSSLLAQAFMQIVSTTSLCTFAPLCDQLFLLLFLVQCASCISTMPFKAPPHPLTAIHTAMPCACSPPEERPRYKWRDTSLHMNPDIETSTLE